MPQSLYSPRFRALTLEAQGALLRLHTDPIHYIAPGLAAEYPLPEEPLRLLADRGFVIRGEGFAFLPGAMAANPTPHTSHVKGWARRVAEAGPPAGLVNRWREEAIAAGPPGAGEVLFSEQPEQSGLFGEGPPVPPPDPAALRSPSSGLQKNSNSVAPEGATVHDIADAKKKRRDQAKVETLVQMTSWLVSYEPKLEPFIAHLLGEFSSHVSLCLSRAGKEFTLTRKAEVADRLLRTKPRDPKVDPRDLVLCALEFFVDQAPDKPDHRYALGYVKNRLGLTDSELTREVEKHRKDNPNGVWKTWRRETAGKDAG